VSVPADPPTPGAREARERLIPAILATVEHHRSDPTADSLPTMDALVAEAIETDPEWVISRLAGVAVQAIEKVGELTGVPAVEIIQRYAVIREQMAMERDDPDTDSDADS
jgi:hypothetical protein